MAFSKGKRIEDETSERIERLVVKIGCNEGPDAITVTRICRELNCDRRVVYNRFRDVDELSVIVAKKCSQELVDNAIQQIDEGCTYHEKYEKLIESLLKYTYEKKKYFQYFTAMYFVSENKIENTVLQTLVNFIENGKRSGALKEEANAEEAAKSIWFMLTGIGGLLAENTEYNYEKGLSTLMYGVNAVYDTFASTK